MRVIDINTFIEKANLVHNNRYNYSLAEYVNTSTKVKIICEEHGIFLQTPRSHLTRRGCPICGENKRINSKRDSIINFISKANLVHNNRYDYSLVEYIDSYTKVKIICPIHGVFEQIPNAHLNKQGCFFCGKKARITKRTFTTEEFIEKANLIHNNRYDYSLADYVNINTKVKIICPIHGAFEQTPNDHLRNHGCPVCKASKGETQIYNYLVENDIEFEREKCFKDLGMKRFDFYLPELNYCIEFDGIQHFKTNEFFGGKKGLAKRKEADKIKDVYCKENNIQLIRIPYTKINNINEILRRII